MAEDKSADAIGMSGLLVKSTVVMKENLRGDEHPRRRREVPVLLGGAALTRGYVENDLRRSLRRRSASTRVTRSRACA